MLNNKQKRVIILLIISAFALFSYKLFSLFSQTPSNQRYSQSPLTDTTNTNQWLIPSVQHETLFQPIMNEYIYYRKQLILKGKPETLKRAFTQLTPSLNSKQTSNNEYFFYESLNQLKVDDINITIPTASTLIHIVSPSHIELKFDTFETSYKLNQKGFLDRQDIQTNSVLTIKLINHKWQITQTTVMPK